jgi:hypothetical protein
MDTLKVPIAIRAYSERPPRKRRGSRALSANLEASGWVLIFDCETTTDAAQQFRCAFFQVRREGTLLQEGICFDSGTMTSAEVDALRQYAQSHRLGLISVEEFRTKMNRPEFLGELAG